MFRRPIVVRLVIASLCLLAASAVAAQSLPEMRLTPAEIESRYREIKNLTHFDA